jgi:hypothetical protein
MILLFPMYRNCNIHIIAPCTKQCVKSAKKLEETSVSLLYTFHSNLQFISAIVLWGARGYVVVKALRYKPAGRGFDSR